MVGPCAAGKSTLIKLLQQTHGAETDRLDLRHIAQEHSYVPTMWEKISHPDWLLFLDASYQATVERRQLNWTVEEYQEQQRRLAHAREHAHFYLMTDGLSPEQVADRVIQFLASIGVWTP